MMRYIACAILIAAVAGCGEARITEAPQLSLQSDNPNALVFPNVARPYGARLAACAVGQQGAVWFIPRIAGPRVFSGSRNCTIPIGKAIFLEIGAYVNPWPCPDTSFHPAPGQSMYDFL